MRYVANGDAMSVKHWLIFLAVLLALVACAPPPPSSTETDLPSANPVEAHPTDTARPFSTAPPAGLPHLAAAARPPRPTPFQGPIHLAGEIIEIDNQQIALYGAKLDGGDLTAHFIIKNNTQSELTVSQLISFSAQNPDGTLPVTDIVSCPGFAAPIPPGGVEKGQVCWTSFQADGRVFYRANLFEQQLIAWRIPSAIPEMEITFQGVHLLAHFQAD